MAPLPDEVFRHFVATRFDTLDVPEGSTCKNVHYRTRSPCGAPLSRAHAYHCCRKAIGERHSALSWAWQRQCLDAGWRAQKEHAVLVWRDNAASHKRADVYIVVPNGLQFALDMKIMSGDGVLATLLAEGERAKMTEYFCANGILPEGVRMIPLVAHARGFLGLQSCRTLLDLKRAQIEKSLWHWVALDTSTHACTCLWRQASPASC